MKLPQIYNILKARPSLHCPQGTWNFLATGVFYLQLVDQKASLLFIILNSFPQLSWQKTLRHHQRPIIIKHLQPSPKTHPKTQETSSRTTKHHLVVFLLFFPNFVISLISNRCLEQANIKLEIQPKKPSKCRGWQRGGAVGGLAGERMHCEFALRALGGGCFVGFFDGMYRQQYVITYIYTHIIHIYIYTHITTWQVIKMS